MNKEMAERLIEEDKLNALLYAMNKRHNKKGISPVTGACDNPNSCEAHFTKCLAACPNNYFFKGMWEFFKYDYLRKQQSVLGNISIPETIIFLGKLDQSDREFVLNLAKQNNIKMHNI